MKAIREILRLKWGVGLSHERIARACGVSKGAVAKYASLASARGLCWPLPAELDDAHLEALLFPERLPPSQFVLPDCGAIHSELKRKGVTLQLLWGEYCRVHGARAYRYTQYCEHYRRWKARQRRSMRQVHIAGEKMFIDYCGPTMPVIDRATGEERQAQVFVAVLGASSYTFAEATWTQALPDWIGSHVRAFAFFGGVPELLVPDNLLSGVSDRCRYEPVPNQTYAEMARHYGTAILPARPRKPKDKAKAESAVLLVERWIMARLRHHTFFSLAELNDAIRELLSDLNMRPFQKLPGSRRSQFEELDQPALQPLPAEPYAYTEWKKAKPGIDYHVEVGGRFYSVPHKLVGEMLDIRITAEAIEVMHRSRRVASHVRHGPARYSTDPAHMPKAHRAHRDWTPGRFLNWARGIGPATLGVVQHQLENRPHPEHGYRACLGILNLSRRYDRMRLEGACQRALELGAPRYKSIASILKKGLDQQPIPHDETTTTLPDHANLRGPAYYH